MFVNKAIIVGNLTKDPELKSTTTGRKVVSFSMATNKNWKDRQGNKQESVEYHNCVAWGRTAEVIAEYAKKGQKLYIEGFLQTRSWEKDGVKRYSTEIVVDIMQLGSKPGGASINQSSSTYENQGSQQDYSNDEEEINVDQIPF